MEKVTTTRLRAYLGDEPVDAALSGDRPTTASEVERTRRLTAKQFDALFPDGGLTAPARGTLYLIGGED